AAAQAVGDLVQCAPALRRVLLELAGARADELGCRPLLLFTRTRDHGAVLVDRRLESLTFFGDALLDLGAELLLPVAQPLQLLLEPGLVLVEIGRPLGEA